MIRKKNFNIKHKTREVKQQVSSTMAREGAGDAGINRQHGDLAVMARVRPAEGL